MTESAGFLKTFFAGGHFQVFCQTVINVYDTPHINMQSVILGDSSFARTLTTDN